MTRASLFGGDNKEEVSVDLGPVKRCLFYIPHSVLLPTKSLSEEHLASPWHL